MFTNDISLEDRHLLRLLARPLSDADIAARLYLSVRSVQRRRASLMRRAAASNAFALGAHAIAHGWLSPHDLACAGVPRLETQISSSRATACTSCATV
jgi:hypothetical protein